MLLLCLPLLLAAAPGTVPQPAPKTAEPPKTEHVERMPPTQVLAILGRNVSSPDGKAIGRLVNVLVDAGGVPQAAVIDFGGFMGVGARKIAVHWTTLHFAPGDPKHPITLDLTVNQIKAAPEYTTDKPASVVEHAVEPSTPPTPATLPSSHTIGQPDDPTPPVRE